MIVFKTVKWQNFLSTGNAVTEIDLHKSRSTLIVGSNGAGKSTILDAISFALFNKPFRKINKPQLINTINGRELLVEIEFSVGANEYLVRRGMKPAIFEIFKDGVLLNQAAAARDYQATLERNIIKLNHRSFCQIIVLGSATYVPFMQLPTYQRREVIEDLLDIQVFSVMNSLLKDRVSSNKDAQQQAKYNVDMNEERIELQKKYLASMQRDIDAAIDQKREGLSVLQQKMLAYETAIGEATIAVEALSEQMEGMRSINDKIIRIQSIRERLHEKSAKLKNELGFYHDNDTCPTCKQGIEHDFKSSVLTEKEQEKNAIEEKIPELDGMYTQLLEQLAEMKALQDQINAKNRQLIELRSEQRANEQRIKEVTAEIEKLSSSKNVNTDRTELDSLIAIRGKLEHERERLAKLGMVHTAASALLKDDGIKAKIIKQYVPIMNKMINKYLAAMDFFVQFELNENFEEKIRSRFRDEFSYQSFSEGEKLRINLAILFSWRAIAKMRNSASTNLLIMDEVLDGSLDAAGTDEFLKIIDELTKDTNLFIISHKGDVLADKFHSAIRFEKHGNFSRMAA